MNQERKWEITKLISSILLKCLAFLLIILLLFTVLFQWIKYDENSMNPAVKAGDLLLVDHWNKDFQIHDLAAVERDGKILIRRVVALGGDVVEITEEGLWVNGVLQIEDYAQGETKLYEGGFSGKATLSGEEVFLLADVRDGAEDSRAFGPVTKSACLGRVVFFLRRRNF